MNSNWEKKKSERGTFSPHKKTDELITYAESICVYANGFFVALLSECTHWQDNFFGHDYNPGMGTH